VSLIGLDPVTVKILLDRPGVGDELCALGVQVLETMGGEYVYVEPEHEARVKAIVAANTAAKVEPDLSGEPLPALPTLEALRLYASQVGIRAVERSTALTFRQARRVASWDASGAVRWDPLQGRVTVADGYRLIPDRPREPKTVRLIRA
jgi:hypothetical protein